MNNKNRAVSGICALAVATLVPVMANAGSTTNKGANPNGKPFIEIAGEIVEVEGEISSLQDQVDSLVGRVETVEDAQAAMVANIADLQAENASLQAQVDANAADVDSLEAEISALNSAILDLEQDIADLGDADGSLAAQIADHEASITTLALAIDTLEGDLQASIDNNTALINQMQQEIDSIQSGLDLYQLLVSGSCPDGQSIREIDASGAVVCEVDDVSTAATATVYRVHNYANTVNGFASVELTCPAGSILTGGGFNGNFGSSSSLGGWPKVVWGNPNNNTALSRQYIAEVVGSQYAGVLFAQAICLQIN